MTLKEIYKLPDGSDVKLAFTPSFYDDKENFPCPSVMTKAFNGYIGYSIPMLDVTNVTSMESMFNGCANLLLLDLSTWNTSNVSNMTSMFSGCTALKKIKGIENLNVSKNTTMKQMFYGCSGLTSLDLSSWDTSNVTDMDNAFASCSSLVSISAIKADKLSISSYTSIFGSSNNTTLVDFGGFINLKSSWNGSYAVEKLTALSHQSLINILNGLYDFTGNGEVPTSAQGKIKLGTTHLAKLSDDEKAIATNKGWVLS